MIDLHKKNLDPRYKKITSNRRPVRKTEHQKLELAEYMEDGATYYIIMDTCSL